SRLKACSLASRPSRTCAGESAIQRAATSRTSRLAPATGLNSVVLNHTQQTRSVSNELDRRDATGESGLSFAAGVEAGFDARENRVASLNAAPPTASKAWPEAGGGVWGTRARWGGGG